MLWTGVVTTAYPTWAQSFGQRSVPPSTAAVVYTAQPLWSAAFGAAALGERLEPQARSREIVRDRAEIAQTPRYLGHITGIHTCAGMHANMHVTP